MAATKIQVIILIKWAASSMPLTEKDNLKVVLNFIEFCTFRGWAKRDIILSSRVRESTDYNNEFLKEKSVCLDLLNFWWPEFIYKCFKKAHRFFVIGIYIVQV